MSDLFKTREKVEKGTDWRGTITVEVDGDQQELSVRQLRDTEYWEVMALIDLDEIEEFQESLPEDVLEEYEELQDEDSLTDSEEERLSTLQEELEDSNSNMFDTISPDTFEGIRQCARYSVEPDDDDVREAMVEYGEQIKERYGDNYGDEEARKWIQSNVIDPMIDNSTDFTSFTIGVKALTETNPDEGN